MGLDDGANAVLPAIGYNLRLILAWLRQFLYLTHIAIRDDDSQPSALVSPFNSRLVLTDQDLIELRCLIYRNCRRPSYTEPASE